MPEQAVKHGMEAYEQYGFAGLFVFIFLSLCVLFVVTTRRFENKIEEMQKNTIISIKDSTQAAKDVNETLKDVTKSLEESAKQSSEALNYMRVRDTFFGKGPKT